MLSHYLSQLSAKSRQRIQAMTFMGGLFFVSLSAAQTTVVGSTQADFGVNDGVPSYSIPLSVAPGRGGMQPELSLNYSQGGNNILGVGWSIGGLTGIQRCAANLDQDGFTGSVNFNSNDRYCMGGQRLIPVSGANGGVGTEYRTETDNYSRIVSVGGSTNNPDHFVVTTKAGLRFTYGGGGNATHSLAQGRLSWSIRQMNDSTGNNPVTYSYFIDQNTQYISSINYAGGQVSFNYESRSDKNAAYYLNNPLKIAKRLNNIAIYGSGNTFIKRYNIGYRYQGLANTSQLTSVQECTSSECKKAATFTWATNNTNTIFSYGSSTAGGFDNDHNMYFNDYNNDGRTDYAVHHPRLSGGALKVYLANSNGSFSHAWTGGGTTATDTQLFFGDYNGDGKLDYITQNREVNSGKFYVHLGNGNGSFSGAVWVGGGGHDNNHQFFFDDYNRDGRTDYIVHHPREYGGQFRVHLATGNGAFSGSPVWTGGGSGREDENYYFNDYNGDGIVDYIRQHYDVGNGVFYVYLGNGSGGFTHVSTGGGYPDNDHKFYFDDYNGDGATDYISYHPRDNSGRFRVHLSKGNGTFTGVVWSGGGSTNENTNFYFGDYNGDRVIDYMSQHHGTSGGQFKVYLGHGDGVFNTTPTWSGSGSTDDDMRYYFGDYNGDGLLDHSSQLHSISGGQARHYINNSLDNQFVITRIVDSTENTIDISYKPLTDSSVYTKGNSGSFPIQDLQNAQYVVSQVQSSNGIGGTSTVNYRYEGLKANYLGRGSYGYSKITETFSETGKTTETYYNQTGYPLIGYVDRVVEKYNGQTINESVNTYAITITPYREKNTQTILCKPGGNCPTRYHGGDVYAVNLTQTVDKSYELNGSLVKTVTTSHSNIDSYGNIGRLSVTTTGNGQTFSKITDSSYANDTSRWYLGRLTQTTVTHQAPNQLDQQRRSQFIYDTNTGLLTTEKIISLSTGLPLSTKTYSYDAYGQQTQVSATVSGLPTRTTSTSYDLEGKPLQTCNALNQCETNTYTSQGWLASTTGPNGIATQWQYDSFGRVIKEIRADGTQTTTSFRFATNNQCGAATSHAYSCTITQTTGSQPATVQYDRLNRKVRTITTGFDGRLSYSDTEYNSDALVARVSRNYFAGDQVYWANSSYDALDRVVSMDEPGPHGSRTVINTIYNGLTTTVRSGPEQREKVTVTNAIGQVIHRSEEEGSYVDYTYTADDNLKTTRVAGNAASIVSLSYDEFGRKIAMNDPDMGQWSYTYNGFGELISQTDAKGQTTTMQYDVLGRLISRTEPEGTSTWVYGDNSAPQGSVGKLLSESNSGMTKTYFYDTLGRPIETLTDITGEQVFSTQTLYDSIGRVSRTIYPGSDNFYTENVYNPNGFLEKVQGLRSNSEQYDLGQLTPLINDAVSLATQFSSQAQQLSSIGQFYQSRIDNYQALLDKQTIHFEQGTVSDLDIGRGYQYLHGSAGNTYIKVPDTFIPIHGDILIPIILPATHHYHVTDSNGQQTVTQISAATFDAIEHTLTDIGDEIYIIDNNTITCACASVGHNQYVSTLNSHEALLDGIASTADTSATITKASNFVIIPGLAIGTPIATSTYTKIALPPESLRHINNTLIELQTVQSLINKQVQTYANSAAQLVVLAEQTLAAADNSFQYERTLVRGANAYTELVNDNQYTTYWRAIDVDASGRISAEVYGNGMVNDYVYNQATGQLQQINSGLLAINPERHLEYQYDAYQNVTLRHDLANDIRETFEYDRLDRLTRTDVVSDLYNYPEFNGSQTQDYDAFGNIIYKSDVGHYSYGAGNAGIHAVTSAGGNTYTYDANGNMLSGDGRSLTWSSFNKPTLITKNGKSAAFEYGADRARYKKVNHNGDKTLYVGSLYEYQTRNSGADTEEKHYIYANGQLVAEHIVSTQAGVQTRYLHKDALGSVDLVTDAYANVVDRRSFDAWGKLRNLLWKDNQGINDPLYLVQLPYTNKGFTGHEHVQEVDVIHMNGRVYDATLARFMSADPHIQEGAMTQSYNRYSYVMNNPLKYTDPSGYFFKKLFGGVLGIKKLFSGIKKVFKKLKPFVSVIAAGVASFFCPPCSATVIGAISGAVGAAANGGNILRGAITGGLTALASGYIGNSTKFGEAGKVTLKRAVAHGVVGGTMNVIHGGKFGSGFFSSAFAKSVSGRIQRGAEKLVEGSNIASDILGAAGAALVGGTVSVIGGGKFANGAQTAAIQYLFNQVSESIQKKNATARYNSLKKRVNADARNDENAVLRLDSTDIKVIAEYMSVKGLTGNVLDDLLVPSDTFLYAPHLSGRQFYVEGVGKYYGGEINYIGVGVVSARHGISEGGITGLSTLWNGTQYMLGGGDHNITQIKTGSAWARFGNNYYDNR